MVPIHALWLPIVVSAAIVFVLSWIMHMLLPLHRADYKKVASEDALMDAMRSLNVAPGDYMVPSPPGPAAMKDPAFKAKLEKGPVVMMTVMKYAAGNMGISLAQWFAYLLLVGVFAAYVSGRALGHDAEYLRIFRFAGCTSFIAYTIALWQDAIWYQRSWGTVFRYTFDGFVYSLMTAGTFGWLWPR